MMADPSATSTDVKEVATIALTDEQRDMIEKATGVKLQELSVLRHTGSGARALNPVLIAGSSVVACW
jgi:hypothetical protein